MWYFNPMNDVQLYTKNQWDLGMTPIAGRLSWNIDVCRLVISVVTQPRLYLTVLKYLAQYSGGTILFLVDWM